mmetsp:Transcript_17009/g.40983  ORF Transcript_17009/g.40983 Transcript_17009/m.40983 type:complete len:408 (-) Transcript_17009:74-1297(-)
MRRGPLQNADLVLTQVVDQRAVCNDGSPSVYWMSKPWGGSRTWHIFLEGGSACWDAESCALRRFDRTSSAGAAHMLHLDGVFSRIDHPLADAGKVFIKYCSSDSWVGNASTVIFDDTWHFRGKQIVSAVVDQLLRSDMRFADVVVVGGCSAGGRGALYNLDDICERVRTTSGAVCVGFMDAAWWPLLDDTSPLNTWSGMGWELWQPEMPQGCVLANPQHPWRCFFAETLLPHVRTRVMFTSVLFDSFQIMHNGGIVVPVQHREELDWIWALRDKMEAVVEATVQGTQHVIFLSSCYGHCMQDSELYFEVSIREGFFSGYTMNTTFSLFLHSAVKGVVKDSCGRMECSTCCDVVPASISIPPTRNLAEALGTISGSSLAIQLGFVGCLWLGVATLLRSLSKSWSPPGL